MIFPSVKGNVLLFQLFYLGLLDEAAVCSAMGELDDSVAKNRMLLLSLLAELRTARRDRLSDAQILVLMEALCQLDPQCVSLLISRVSSNRSFKLTVKFSVHAAFTAGQLSRLFQTLAGLTAEEIPKGLQDWFFYCSKHRFGGVDIEPIFTAIISPVDGALPEIDRGVLRCFEKGIIATDITEQPEPRRRRL